MCHVVAGSAKGLKGRTVKLQCYCCFCLSFCSFFLASAICISELSGKISASEQNLALSASLVADNLDPPSRAKSLLFSEADKGQSSLESLLFNFSQ